MRVVRKAHDQEPGSCPMATTLERAARSRWRSACRSTSFGPFCSMRLFMDGMT
jgi:hypothetical protein